MKKNNQEKAITDALKGKKDKAIDVIKQNQKAQKERPKFYPN